VLTVLVWFSSSAHPEKPKKKVCTNDARIARYSAPGVWLSILMTPRVSASRSPASTGVTQRLHF
jgi:hypothetical protein